MNNRVMIVDDSIFAYEEMKYMLKDSGFEIVGYAKSGEEALELYDSVKPDVVTMDIILPGMDGIDAAEQILKKWPNASVIMVSSLAYDETIVKSETIGAKDFLFKPLEKEPLLKVLRRVVEL